MHALQVNYVNAHATSSLAGDLAEVKALKQVFKNPSQIKMNATKVHGCTIYDDYYYLFLVQQLGCA
jgi:hypothetical protein